MPSWISWNRGAAAGCPGRQVWVVSRPLALALAPAPFPRAAFEGALALARPLNALVEAVSGDPDYLARTLAPAAAHDEFAHRLLRLHEEVRQRRGDAWLGARALGIHRSDYLLDEPSGRLLQVELNTIASSFGALASRAAAGSRCQGVYPLFLRADRRESARRWAGPIYSSGRGWL